MKNYDLTAEFDCQYKGYKLDNKFNKLEKIEYVIMDCSETKCPCRRIYS
jgi:hypothetical protein